MTQTHLSLLTVFLSLTIGDATPSHDNSIPKDATGAGECKPTIGDFSQWNRSNWDLTQPHNAKLKQNEQSGTLISPWVCRQQTSGSPHHCLVLKFNLDSSNRLQHDHLSVQLKQKGFEKLLYLQSVNVSSRQPIEFQTSAPEFQIVIKGNRSEAPFKSPMGVDYEEYKNTRCNQRTSVSGDTQHLIDSHNTRTGHKSTRHGVDDDNRTGHERARGKGPFDDASSTFGQCGKQSRPCSCKFEKDFCQWQQDTPNRWFIDTFFDGKNRGKAAQVHSGDTSGPLRSPLIYSSTSSRDCVDVTYFLEQHSNLTLCLNDSSGTEMIWDRQGKHGEWKEEQIPITARPQFKIEFHVTRESEYPESRVALLEIKYWRNNSQCRLPNTTFTKRSSAKPITTTTKTTTKKMMKTIPGTTTTTKKTTKIATTTTMTTATTAKTTAAAAFSATVTGSATKKSLTESTSLQAEISTINTDNRSGIVDTQNPSPSDGFSQDDDESSHHLFIIIVVSTVAVVVVIALISVVVVYCQRRSTRKRRDAASRSGESVEMNTTHIDPQHAVEAPAAGLPADESNYSIDEEAVINNGSETTTRTSAGKHNPASAGSDYSSVDECTTTAASATAATTAKRPNDSAESSQPQAQPAPYSVVNKPKEGRKLELDSGRSQGVDDARKVTGSQKLKAGGDYNVISFQRGGRPLSVTQPDEDVYNHLGPGVLNIPDVAISTGGARNHQEPTTGSAGLYHIVEPDPENPSLLKYKESEEYHHLDWVGRSPKESSLSGACARGGAESANKGRGGGNLYDHVHAENDDTYSRVRRGRKPAMTLDETYSHIP